MRRLISTVNYIINKYFLWILLKKAHFLEYYEVVTKSLGKYSEKCVEDVKIAFDLVEELLTAQDGPDKLKLYFK